MRRKSVSIVLLFGYWIAAGLSAQSRSDFSGTWVLDPPSEAPIINGPPTNFGARFTVQQDAKLLRVTQIWEGQQITLTFNVDGSESISTVQTPSGNYQEVSRLIWNRDGRLVIVTKHFGRASAEQYRILSLEDGKLLVEPPAPGYTSAPHRYVYKRQ